MLTLHHLGVSQSERIVWLLEELGIPYKIVRHSRDPVLAPKALKDVPGNHLGRAPFLEDPDAGVTVAESLAIAEYVIYKYANGRLALQPDNKRFAEYLHWFHYANSTMHSSMMTGLFLQGANVPSDAQFRQFSDARIHSALKAMDDHLQSNKWLAGDEFTAADCMSMYSVTTQRYFGPQVSLKGYDHLLRWIKNCSEREAYKRAMEKGDPEMKLLLDAEPPEKGMMELGGVTSDHWKKK